jgi:hypothetical protein
MAAGLAIKTTALTGRPYRRLWLAKIHASHAPFVGRQVRSDLYCAQPEAADDLYRTLLDLVGAELPCPDLIRDDPGWAGARRGTEMCPIRRRSHGQSRER